MWGASLLRDGHAGAEGVLELGDTKVAHLCALLHKQHILRMGQDVGVQSGLAGVPLWRWVEIIGACHQWSGASQGGVLVEGNPRTALQVTGPHTQTAYRLQRHQVLQSAPPHPAFPPAASDHGGSRPRRAALPVRMPRHATPAQVCWGCCTQLLSKQPQRQSKCSFLAPQPAPV